MPRLVGYKCTKCDRDDEELFNDSEEKPEVLDRKCSECGGKLKKLDIKNNCQRYLFNDRGGL